MAANQKTRHRRRTPNRQQHIYLGRGYKSRSRLAKLAYPELAKIIGCHVIRP